MAVIEGGKIIEDAQGRGSVTVLVIEDLAAGGGIAARAEWCAPTEGAEIKKLGIVPKGASAGIDDSNTAVLVVTDGGGNTIVSKTYDTANQPPAANAYGSLGNPDATHRVLTASEVVRLAVTQGAAADL